MADLLPWLYCLACSACKLADLILFMTCLGKKLDLLTCSLSFASPAAQDIQTAACACAGSCASALATACAAL